MKTKTKPKEHLYIDLYTGKSKWITCKDFNSYIYGDEHDGVDSKGYYMLYKHDDGTTEKEYYDWRQNWEVRRNADHTTFKGEEHILIDFTNAKVGTASFPPEWKVRKLKI